MSWSDVYLFCFLVGVTFSVLSFLAGAVHLHLPIKLHLHLTYRTPTEAATAEERTSPGSTLPPSWPFWRGLAELVT